MDARLPFAERLEQRRGELRLTRTDLQNLTGPSGECVSVTTLKNMENKKTRYRLPRKKSGGNRLMPLELVAKALDVPIGYFLAGFSQVEVAASHYGRAVAAGHIKLVDVLRSTEATAEGLDQFISRLPSSEEELFRLPLYSFQNERALAVIFEIEKIFCGYEMLIVNEPPFVLWDDDDIQAWTVGMGLSRNDARTFERAFIDYRAYFRNLIERGDKLYKVVLNYPTLKRFIQRKGAVARSAWQEDAARLLQYPNFNLVLHRPPIERGDYADDGGVHECEVLCKTKEIPLSLEGMVACQILQTPPHAKPTSYFISPAPRDVVMVQREMNRIDTAWAEALRQYQCDLNMYERSGGPTPEIVRRHTANLIRAL